MLQSVPDQGWRMSLHVADDRVDPVTRRMTFRRLIPGENRLMHERLIQYAQVVAKARS